MILHPEDAHSCKEQPHAKLRYLPLVINKPSQYITFELLKMTETINNLGNIYIAFVDYYAITYQHNIFHHKNTYTSVLQSLALCPSVQPQNWNSQDFQQQHFMYRLIRFLKVLKLPTFKEYACPCILHGSYKG